MQQVVNHTPTAQPAASLARPPGFGSKLTFDFLYLFARPRPRGQVAFSFHAQRLFYTEV